jgi:hypothetical protein
MCGLAQGGKFRAGMAAPRCPLAPDFNRPSIWAFEYNPIIHRQRKEHEMLTYHSARGRMLRLLCLSLLSVLMVACSSGHEVAYRCDGSAESVAVSYLGAEGETVEETVSLPWETTFTVRGKEISTELAAENLGDEGEMACAVVLDGESNDASAEARIEINGRSTFSGSSSEGFYNTTTEDRPAFEFVNDSPGTVCRIHIAPTGGEWGPNLLGDEPVDGETSQMVTYAFEEGGYYFWVETCDDALAFFDYTDITALEEAQVFTFDTPKEVPRLTVTNAGSGDLCGLSLRMEDGEWSGNFLMDGGHMAPGESKAFMLLPGTHSYRAETCDGDVVEIDDYSIEANAGRRWLITDDLTSGGSVAVENTGDDELCEFYLTSEGEDWGENLLAGYSIPGGDDVIVMHGVDSERYDAKSHICDGSLIGLGTSARVPGDAAIDITIDPKGDRPTLTLANTSSHEVCSIQIDLGSGYVRNLLSDGAPLVPGDEWSAILGDGTFSFQLTTCDGESVEARDVDMSGGDQTLTFYDE